MKIRHHLLRKPDDGGEAGGAEGGAPASSPAPAPSPAPSPAPAPAPAAPSPSPAPSPAPGPAPSPAPAPAPAPGPAPAPAPKAADTPASWPDNWRDTVSKGDAKLLTRMQRYASPEALVDALVHAQNRISSGELRPVLGKNPTPEQLAEWRTANGIPDKPEAYDLGKDVKVSESGKVFLEQFLPVAHANNMTPAQVKASLKFVSDMNVRAEEDRAVKDHEFEETGEELLRAEWGAEFKRNMGFIHNTLDGAASPEFKTALLGGRLADGTPIGSSPEALRFLMSLALIQNPTGTLVPGFNANPSEGVEQEIKTIEETMRKNRGAYNKDEKMQARYRELIDAREKLKR